VVLAFDEELVPHADSVKAAAPTMATALAPVANRRVTLGRTG
jgi:hypothetical protein